ncbi:MAG: DUF983 domain-containing protein [Bacteroidetes bacterium]|nr:DUF983 domain-containing protein [Bacteroidota bacterium]
MSSGSGLGRSGTLTTEILPNMSEVAFPPKHVSAAKAVFTGRCPVCREGAVFKGPWNRLDFIANNRHCPVCNTDFEPEPGFFYGSMYVSYSFNVATLVAVYLFLWVLFDPESPWVYIAAVIGVTVAIVPFTARLSRMLWMNWFGPFKYDPTAARRMP